VLLDAGVVMLFTRVDPRSGVMLATAVMVADVATNGLAWRVVGIDALATAVPMRVAMPGYVRDIAPWLWREHRT